MYGIIIFFKQLDLYKLHIFNMVDSYKIVFIVFLTFPYKNNSAKLPIVLEPTLQKAYGEKWLL